MLCSSGVILVFDAHPPSPHSSPGQTSVFLFFITRRAMCLFFRNVPVRREFNGYMFTGELRPAALSTTRVVPPHIKRPDYASHPEGERTKSTKKGCLECACFASKVVYTVRQSILLGIIVPYE